MELGAFSLSLSVHNMTISREFYEKLGFEAVDEFVDIRDLRSQVDAAGLQPDNDTTQDSATGPASFTLVDPDGNAILVDQHV